MLFTTLFFDLDDTLYPASNGLWNAIRDRMSDYMQTRVGIPAAQIPELRRIYYETYGTTLRGLQLHYSVKPADYLAYVHDLPLQDFLQPDPALRALLSGLPQRKWIFTNADAAHARRVLAHLELEDCFIGIVDVAAMGYHCKPEAEAYRLALEKAGEEDPHRCVVLDDSPRNLAAAWEMGFTTVLIGANGPDPVAHYHLTRLHDLWRVFPDLWKK
jgi:pyrimidine 5'-nucleotidase